MINFIPSYVTLEMNHCLLNPFGGEEVKLAIFGMNPTKALGYDGMHALFFQKYWQIVRFDVIRVCLGF